MNRRSFICALVALFPVVLLTKTRRGPRWISPRRVEFPHPPPMQISATINGGLKGSVSANASLGPVPSRMS